jgi:radical SAM superfamily enzyme YgiQ (UPF0313 family)
MFYEGIIYRPPSEASSLILQVTTGCRHNQCTFCSMYKGKPFRIKTRVEITELIDEAVSLYPLSERIFLADGDALTLDTDVLVEILQELYRRFPRLKRVGIYGGPKDILEKSLEELKNLKSHGLEIIYLGVESGNSKVLAQIKKGVSPDEMITAGKRIVNSGMQLSCTIILGIAGKSRSKEHALDTAKVLSAINPHYIGALTLMLEPQAPLLKQVTSGEFKLLSPWDSLQELETIIRYLDVSNCLFRSNHASNYLSLKGHLPSEKSELLATLEEVINNDREDLLKPETWRGL